MQITVGAKCWDGTRRKSLNHTTSYDIERLPEIIVNESFAEKFKRGCRRLNDPKVRAVIGYGIPLVLLAHGIPAFGLTHAFAQGMTPDDAVPAMAAAAMAADTKAKIMHAFDPLINMISSIAYPIAGVMISGACLFIMVGHREKGMQILQNAAIGFLLVKMAPLLLQLLVGVSAGL